MVQRIPTCIAHLFFTAAGVIFLTCFTSNWLFFYSYRLNGELRASGRIAHLWYKFNTKWFDIESINFVKCQILILNTITYSEMCVMSQNVICSLPCSMNNYNFFLLILHFSGTNSHCWTQDIKRINLSFQTSIPCSIARVIDSTKSLFLLKFNKIEFCWNFFPECLIWTNCWNCVSWLILRTNQRHCSSI